MARDPSAAPPVSGGDACIELANIGGELAYLAARASIRPDQQPQIVEIVLRYADRIPALCAALTREDGR